MSNQAKKGLHQLLTTQQVLSQVYFATLTTYDVARRGGDVDIAEASWMQCCQIAAQLKTVHFQIRILRQIGDLGDYRPEVPFCHIDTGGL